MHFLKVKLVSLFLNNEKYVFILTVESIDHGISSHDFIQPQTKWNVPSVPSTFNNKTSKRKKGSPTEVCN